MNAIPNNMMLLEKCKKAANGKLILLEEHYIREIIQDLEVKLKKRKKKYIRVVL